MRHLYAATPPANRHVNVASNDDGESADNAKPRTNERCHAALTVDTMRPAVRGSAQRSHAECQSSRPHVQKGEFAQ